MILDCGLIEITNEDRGCLYGMIAYALKTLSMQL